MYLLKHCFKQDHFCKSKSEQVIHYLITLNSLLETYSYLGIISTTTTAKIVSIKPFEEKLNRFCHLSF